MKVLSLFDGISCGRIALERAGIEVERYVAYEIDEPAIIVSNWNYPDIEHKGSVEGADFTQYEGFDLVIGGFPCTDLSISKMGREGLAGKSSRLFWEQVRAIKEINPRYFLVENNYGMPKKDEAIITETLGVKPIFINSDLVSAQSRKRLYWTNIPGVDAPEDRGIILEDIIEYGKVDRLKSLCLTQRYCAFTGSQNYLRRRYFGKSMGQAVFSLSPELQKNAFKKDPRADFDNIGTIRRLTPIECERLQTVPEGYTEMVSDTERYRQLGNGWTVDVIAHIFNFINLDNLL